MSLGPVQDAWTSRKIPTTYEWQPIDEHSSFSGNQATYISLTRRRLRKSGAKLEPQLYVCKWYHTAGVRLDSLGGPKYIQQEHATLSSVRHENIVGFADFGYDPKGAKLARLYLEYCPKGDLQRYEESKDNALTVRECAQVFHQIARALLYLHHGIDRQGDVVQLARPVAREVDEWHIVLHRDIKPANSKCLCIYFT